MKGYQIDTTLPLKEGVMATLASVIQQLDLPDAFQRNPHVAIHATRKTIKRIRALLKMIRDGAGYGVYLRENRFYRNISRHLSQSRDLYVLLETLHSVTSKKKEPVSAADELKNRITLALEKEMEALSAPGGAFEMIPAALDDAVKRLDATLQLSDDFNSLDKGMRRTYRKGRRLFSVVKADPHMGHTHEFRKSSRTLQFQMELIVPLYPSLLRGYAASIDNLTEKLGRIRDLQRLQLFAKETGIEASPGAPDENFLKTIQAQSHKAFQGIYRLAPLIYAEKPGRFVGRIHQYWKTHQQQH